MSAAKVFASARSSHWDFGLRAPEFNLREQGFALLSPTQFLRIADIDAALFDDFAQFWNDLPPDQHLLDGGSYRFRRHASLILDASAHTVVESVHRAHWQSTDYNALHGGLERWFTPLDARAITHPALLAVITQLGRLFAATAGVAARFVEVHQFRIDTASGIGRPTPEGAHRDGVDFVAVILIERVAVRGGETRVFQADGPAGVRFTMLERGTCLLLDDTRVIHESTPLQPDGTAGHRDTLVITFRRDGFQDPPKA